MTLESALYILAGLPMTIALTGLAMLFGAIFGFPLMLASQSKFFLLRHMSVALVSLVRSVPPILWLFLIFFGLGSGVLTLTTFAAAVVTFSMIAAVNMAEIYRGGIVAIHHGQYEAATALNFSRFRLYTDVIIPQMVRVCIPAAATYAIGLMKDSAIASTIGVADLAFRGNQISLQTYRGLTIFAFVGLLYIVISLPVAALSREAERRLRAKVSR
ncbi:MULTISPECIES: amino acid ABC transporter permease [Brucella]|uniref:Amino acid ABC transporter permease n=1 Tax=Brucella tritici TaxID=94626 RepID=A0A6L3Y9E8_9HYPH|nr:MULTISPECIES: amino acid ABC transporter permease [Brucella]KAB2675783.1 amino acid ABC transporter permease [Brucella tritici]MDX4075548.1 amino acid ABC transporter permease [Brucella sp. NBRC 113783]